MELDSDDCLRQIMAIKGVLGASLVDCQSGLTINSTGREPCEHGQVTAAGIAGMVAATIEGAPFAGAGVAEHLDDILVTAGNGYHLVHFLGPQPGGALAVYVWLDRVLGNLAMAQRGIRTVTDGLVPA
jgi:hypothetical protein